MQNQYKSLKKQDYTSIINENLLKGTKQCMKKKNTNKNSNYPFFNEMKQVKYEFKKMVDEMPDEEFAIFMLHFIEWLEELEGEEFDDYDEEIEDLPF